MSTTRYREKFTHSVFILEQKGKNHKFLRKQVLPRRSNAVKWQSTDQECHKIATKPQNVRENIAAYSRSPSFTVIPMPGKGMTVSVRKPAEKAVQFFETVFGAGRVTQARNGFFILT